ncbi:malate dehydrogenase 1B [Pelobates cultripes]|uniref:Malate dehydrogenase 1B n=1 Tax=Pelobates cultripes TaxID=61616 RepID=A0AAD1WI08_PELCU|nr:malate dehydrogenase 1B [Pelobates cultripes]
MAKFVLAGKADCPYYAKAELLADYLQKNLPHFRVHKITQHPDDWEQWLAELCQNNGWKHKKSPIIWRELLDRGGKGLLIGGFNEFMEHAQDYYNVTSAMVSAQMKEIASENYETHIEIQREEEHIKNSFNPLHVWITRAAQASGTQIFLMQSAARSRVGASSGGKKTQTPDKNQTTADITSLVCLKELSQIEVVILPAK